MASLIDICNMALSHIEARAIVSLTEDSKESEKCNLFVHGCIDSVLSDGNWNYLTQTRRLTLIDQETEIVDATTTPPTEQIVRPIEWAYMYAYPADVLKMNGLINRYHTDQLELWKNAYRSINSYSHGYGDFNKHYNHFTDFEIMQGKNDKVIVTNVCDAVACFTLKNTDITQLSAPLVKALSYKLAMDLASPLVGGNEATRLIQINQQMYDKHIATARTHDQSQRSQAREFSPIFDSYV